MAVQVSHRIYPEIPETAAIRSSEETSRGSVSSIGEAERMLDRRGAHHAGSRTHVDQCAAKIGGIERGGVHQGQGAIHVARHFLKRERNYAGQRIWARGFFVDTVGRNTETIRKYKSRFERLTSSSLRFYRRSLTCINQRKNASSLAGGLRVWSTRKGLRSDSSGR